MLMSVATIVSPTSRARLQTATLRADLRCGPTRSNTGPGRRRSHLGQADVPAAGADIAASRALKIDSANDSQRANTALAAALVPDGVITDPILRSIIAVFLFFVVIPVFGVLLFFFPPTFPAAAALSALPEPPSPAEPEIDTHPATSKPQMAEVDPVMSKPQVAEVDPVMSKPQMAEVDPMVSKPQET